MANILSRFFGGKEEPSTNLLSVETYQRAPQPKSMLDMVQEAPRAPFGGDDLDGLQRAIDGALTPSDPSNPFVGNNNQFVTETELEPARAYERMPTREQLNKHVDDTLHVGSGSALGGFIPPRKTDDRPFMDLANAPWFVSKAAVNLPYYLRDMYDATRRAEENPNGLLGSSREDQAMIVLGAPVGGAIAGSIVGAPAGALAANALRQATKSGDSVLKKVAHELDGQGFYSPSLEAAKKINQGKGTVEQMRAQILKAGGKEKELQAMGFDKAFADPKAKATREQVETWLRDNRVRHERNVVANDGGGSNYDNYYAAERAYRDKIFKDGNAKEYIDPDTGEAVVEYGGHEYFRAKPKDPDTPWSGEFEGKEPYAFDRARERMDEAISEDFRHADPIDLGVDWEPRFGRYFPEFSPEDYAEVLMSAPGKEGQTQFTGSHWGTPNVMAHYRRGDFSEEIPLTPEQEAALPGIRARIKELEDGADKSYLRLGAQLYEDPKFAETYAANLQREMAESMGNPDYQLSEYRKKPGRYEADQYAKLPFEKELDELDKLRRGIRPPTEQARYIGELQSDWGQKGHKAQREAYAKKMFGHKDINALTDIEKAAISKQIQDDGKNAISGFKKDLTPEEVEALGAKATDAYEAVKAIERQGLVLPDALGVLRMERVSPQGRQAIEDAVDSVRTSQWELDLRKGHLDGAKEQLARADDGAKIADILADIEQYQKSVDGQQRIADYVMKAYDNTLAEHNAVKMTPDEAAAWTDAKNRADLARRESDAAFRGAQTGIPEGPLVTNTSDWTDYALKSALIDAASDDIDRLVFPTGDVARSYTYGDEAGQAGYYEGIVPKRLQKTLNKIDKNAKIKFDETDLGGTLDEAASMPYLQLTPEMRKKIVEEGLSLFANPSASILPYLLEQSSKDPDIDGDGELSELEKAISEALK